jgi:nitrous oxide reductase accessory protein NosL
MRNKILRVIMVFLMVSGFAGITWGEGFIVPTKKDKCPVCGMFVYKYPTWIAEIIFKDGTYVVFDGPKDMFKYYFNISRYNKSKTKDDIAEIYVTEYYTTEPMRARDVYFVVGSDVYGPMGEELIPVKGRKEAETFAKDHKGKKILRFEEITPSDIPGMKMMHPEGHDLQ